ncbi:MAG: TonB-dependent receptor [Halioglobus sp.]|nr:TonB-dependent receptor [Halioglobus sp.]
MIRFSLLPALALACVGPQHVLAANPLEEVVVTSSRVPTPLREIGTSVSVVTREDILDAGFNSLYDVLRSQPAVTVSNPGGPGSATALRIRGEEGYRTLVLLDGIDLSDTTAPQVGPRIEHLLSAGIGRVEILRGPQGLMYGADAGGVINIATIAPREGLGGDISAEGGRYGTRQYSADLGGGNDTVDFNLSASNLRTDGFNARSTDTDPRDADGYDNTTWHGRLGWNATDKLRLQLVLREVEAQNRFDECFGANGSTNRCSDDYEQRAWRGQAEYRGERFSHWLYYSNSDTDRQFYADGAPGFATGGSLERSGYLGSYSSGAALRLVYGVDLETERIDDGSLDAQRDQRGYYLEYQGGFGNKLFFTAGVRHDDNDDFGTHTSYRVSGAYLIALAGGELKFKSAYGTGFRAPSLYEASYNNGPFAYPPAQGTQLDEEKSEGLDVGLSWSGPDGTYVEAVYFDQTVTDEIYFDLVSYSGYLQGRGDTDSRGVELIGQWPVLASLSLSANYTYNDTQTSSGSTRVFRPRHLVNAGLNWQAPGQRLALAMNLRLARDAQNVDGRDLDDYEVLEISASFEVAPGLRVYGRVENALDARYEEVPTYNSSGAAAYAGLRYSF